MTCDWQIGETKWPTRAENAGGLVLEQEKYEQ